MVSCKCIVVLRPFAIEWYLIVFAPTIITITDRKREDLSPFRNYFFILFCLSLFLVIFLFFDKQSLP